MSQLSVAVLFLTFTTCYFQELFSPALTRYGDWHEWANCPQGTYAAGLQVKAEPDQRGGDDTGLNAVALYCLPLHWSSQEGNTWIMSGEGPFGNWGGVKWCPRGQMIIGFQMKSEPDQRGGDDVAADNIAAYCGNPGGPRDKDNWIEGDTEGWGRWTDIQWCTEGSVVCSIKTQIEGDQGGGDDTSLNNVNLWCCQVSQDDCTPDVELVTIDQFDNSQGGGEMTQQYGVTISFTRMSSTSDTLTESEKQTVATKISSELGSSFSGLTAKVASEVSNSMESGFTRSLQTMVQETVQNSYTKTLTIKIPAGTRARVQQLVFKCGDYRLGVAQTINSQY